MTLYDSILVAIDGSDPAKTAASEALRVADVFDASVTAVTAIPEHSLSLSPEDNDTVSPDEATEQAIESLESQAAETGVPFQSIVERGSPHELVLSVADRVDADLVTMGTHGRTGLDRLLLGSVADRTLRTSDVPVLVTPALGTDRPPLDEILVPTDGSECATAAVDDALPIARRFDADVHAISVLDVSTISAAAGPALPQIIEDLEESHHEFVEQVAERADAIEVSTSVPRGPPARVIREYAEDTDADLIAMGTHGRRGLDRYLLGSTAERVIRTAAAPVLAVPP